MILNLNNTGNPGMLPKHETEFRNGKSVGPTVHVIHALLVDNNG